MRRTPDERLIFALLGVDETTSWEELRRAFRDAVRASHPDLHAGDPDAERRLKTLNAAWESVNTPGRWAQYVAQPPGSEPRSSSAVASFGRLRVQRQRSGSAGLRHWKLELDGEVIASIANGDTSILQAGPGRHSLRIFYEWYSSPALEIELRAGQELHLGCRQQPNPFLSVYAPKRSLVLELLGAARFA
jgi:hypothetical protein